MNMTREEAIEVVKKNWPDSRYTSLREALGFLIPELRESEDERVRKEIVSIVKAYRENCIDEGTHRFDDCLSWLEKQKEQIPYIDFVIKPHKGDDNNPYDMRVSEAQEYAIKRGFGVPFNDGEVYVDERHITQTIGNILRWADEHPLEQKPAWSEEDECHLASIIGCIELCNKDTEDAASVLGYYDSDIAWLKSLRPQPKQEWSKKDKKIILALHHALNCADAQNAITKSGIEVSEAATFLQDLIPSWKPSEEQMNALLGAEGILRSLQYDDRAKILASIYEQLKKLM